MFFHSQAYLIFFAVVFTVYWSLPGQQTRVWLLVAASLTFYAFWSQQLAFLVATTTVMDYLIARGMDASRTKSPRRILLAASLAVNLGLLCYFKYANFFLDALRESLQAMGADSTVPFLEVVIPFGISFYTFEAISYTIDVYSRRLPAERNLAHFLLFILFFPHLVAGPIVRARDFLPQAARPKRFSWMRFQLGIEYFLLGLFKKMVIADSMAIYCDPLFADGADPSAVSTRATWAGVLAFALRIYGDFSGYSDMALGSAYMLGYKLTINFRMPYLSTNVAEFWRRWHISLSTWLRDYLFIPLGGSRGSAWLTARNLMITMTLGGLWHGANASFVVWGVLHGALLIAHRLFRGVCRALPALDVLLQTWAGVACRVGLTFFCVSLCWVFFQPSLPRAMIILRRLFAIENGVETPIPTDRLKILLLVLAAAHLMAVAGFGMRLVRRLPGPALGACYGLLFTLSMLLNPASKHSFIYFQF